MSAALCSLRAVFVRSHPALRAPRRAGWTALLALCSVAFAAGETPAFFSQLTLLLLLAAGVAYLSFRVGLVPIIGFLIAGVIAGPSALGLIDDPALIESAAEIGVILLLFAIGIEFSLGRLARLGRLIFLGGGLQVGLVTLVTVLALMPFGVALNAAVFTGCLLALSSTAIVLKLLADRGGTGGEVGQVSLGILIFQDLAVVAMVLLVPMLGGAGGGALDLAWALTKAALLVTFTLVFARRVMPVILEAVARTCSQEIFLLTVVAICFGTAYVSSLAGVSLSLGAFLAGLVVSESRFGRQALGEILPLQILFSAAFFVSVGLLLDLRFLVSHLPVVLLALLAVVLVKTFTTALGVKVLGYRAATAVGAGLLTAQIGEFSFVLERTGRAVGLSPAGLGEVGTQAFIAATVLLMGVTPLLSRLGEGLGERLSRRAEPAFALAGAAAGGGVALRGPNDGGVAAGAGHDESPLGALSDHVLIAGYGVLGQKLTLALSAAGVPFGIVTLSPDGAKSAQLAGYPVLLGDYSRPYTLALAGAERARLLIVADDEAEMASRVASVARANYPELRVVARAGHEHRGDLLSAGASEVVMAEREAALTLLARALGQEWPRDKLETQLDAALGRRTTEFVDLSPVALTETQRASPACTHTAQARAVVPRTDGCEECLKEGRGWVHLRVCLTCGHVGCCDSSAGKHATAHFHATGHPLIKSLEQGEDWAYCYQDTATL